MSSFRILVEEMSDKWAEAHYRRLSADELASPLRDLNAYYRSLSDTGLPRWDRFDLIDAPSAAITYLVVADAVYADPYGDRPDHFVYRLQGAAVDHLVGMDMAGRKVGHVMRRADRNSLLREIDDLLDSGAPVFSQAALEVPERADLMFTRGLFLFVDGVGRPERLLLHLQQGLQTRPRSAES